MDKKVILKEPVPPTTERHPENCVFGVNDLPKYEPPTTHLDYLEAGEHKLTAEALRLRDIHGQILKATDVELATIKGSVKLQFGDIIALAGDFYTNLEPGRGYFPICGAPGFGKSGETNESQRFINAVTSLIEDTDGFLGDLMKLLQQEHQAVENTRSKDESVARAYHTHDSHDACGIPTDEEWAKKTGGLIFGRKTEMCYLYAYIAFTNADHFGKDAITAYSVGHNLALQLAYDAAHMKTEPERWKKLKLAYIYEAFAAHYLTDLFSAGHIRAPRRHLHSPSVAVMNAAVVGDKLLRNPETPIWDFQQRYMHDDDSATGILVQNQLGHQWIMYGDKQFFEPKNMINRARAISALQLSVDELYSAGVKASSRPSDVWKDNMAKFSVLKWIAQPMTSVANDPWVQSWGKYDIHNPAPLWQARNDSTDSQSGWTIRCDINDHSNFGQRKSGTPAHTGPKLWPSATKECIAIRDADFRGDNQYPLEETMQGLISGGFVQIQHLKTAESPDIVAVNWWRPMSVSITDHQYENLTLYNRILDLKADEGSSASEESKSLHWLMQPTQSEQPALTQLIWAGYQDRTGGGIYIRQYVFGPGSYDINHPLDGTKAAIDIGKPGSMKLIMTGKAQLMCDVQDAKATNLARFISGTFLPNSEAPDTACVMVDPKTTRIRVAMHNFTDSVHKETSISGMHVEDQDVVFIKSFRTHAEKEAPCTILLARASSKGNISRCEFSRITFDASADVERFVIPELAFESPVSKQGPCVLVGSVFDSSRDYAVIVAGDVSDVHITPYCVSESGTGMVSCGLHHCKMEETLPLVQPYLTALAPSLSGKGLDVLQISLHQGANNKKKILFRTHARNDQGPNQNSDPWSGCQQSEWYEDPLASDPNGRYFSMKWIRCRYKIAETEYWGVLQVFSWYGIIGTRLFGAGPSRYQYDLIGQQPYLGQTSIAAGNGCTGDWSHGILPWTIKEDWADSATFLPWDKSDLAAGSWGMMKRDLDRPRVEGWEVDKRPLK
ncbi:hypothetical protein KCU73_g4112, partial [Aureobasidium melanogenum]